MSVKRQDPTKLSKSMIIMNVYWTIMTVYIYIYISKYYDCVDTLNIPSIPDEKGTTEYRFLFDSIYVPSILDQFDDCPTDMHST